LLSDYGLADGFVGALHSVLRTLLPAVPIVDLTHDIAPGDVRAGSQALQRAAHYLAPGVVLAVVDPGVGTDRRAVAVQAAGTDVVFVGPDNGLLLPALDALGGPALAVELKDLGYWLASPGPTFAGRDILAPAAAHLAAGGDISALGTTLHHVSLARLPRPRMVTHPDGSLEAEVTWVDRFGNVQLAAGEGDLAGAPLVVVVTAAGPARTARAVRTYAELADGELGILVDSYGSLALSLNGASAASSLGVAERDLVIVGPPRGEPGP
jgi:S-adenosylmethionine hydrolase